MSTIFKTLEALLAEVEAAPSSPASHPRARGTSRLQRATPPPLSAPPLPEEEPLANMLPAPPTVGVRRPSSVTIDVAQAQQGVIWAEVLGKPRAMRPWQPRP